MSNARLSSLKLSKTMNKTLKKKRITYGVSGMMEFETVIMVGQQPMKVLFTGGSINALGTNPAKYTTDSLMLQHSIERSKQFKSGLIKRIRTIELDEEVVIEKNPGIIPPAPKPEESPESGEAEAPKEPEIEVAEETEAKPTEETQTPTKEGAEDNGLTPVEFEVNEDAKDYLEQNFGVVKSKLFNRAAIIEAGKQHGVEIIFV